MKKLIVGLMLLFFSVNVFAWEISERRYTETSKEATNASEACDEMGGGLTH
ncbi:hypothetical protein AGMMS5026_07930 [Endomicrobiia bacterium]|nr:hypothetical protein AGMMS49523_00830 [Endomicrobiia bacterium]GHT11011.1 hypothetical protein AGMMS49571_00610 [Endomicrobiia bacterium]GHT19461.1 hypothetical protein AGMMS49929_03230 [Endomicrobiia bacterium]GHT25831.1 hypothetical protein AGMMS49995_00840 [Endomicrobiia bacterium]GHT31498.1 hypothetical protein AGMMS5026_07930 [Endomicrobiia bacterium]